MKLDKNNLKLSIITVSYNSQDTIKDTINSVLDQTYLDIEYIIIDGNSTDETMNIVNSYGNKISKIISEKDNGIYDAMNKGVLNSSGDIIALLNSDDVYIDKNIVTSIMEIFNNNSQIDILYGDILYVKNRNIDSVVRKWTSKKYFDNFFEFGNVPPHPTLFLKKSVYEEIGLFNTKYRLAADYDLMLRIFKANQFKSFYLNRFIVKMRLGGATNKSFKNILIQNCEIYNSWRDNRFNFPFFTLPLKFINRIFQYFNK